MDRSELYMVETYKCEELKKRLKPMTKWDEVKPGTKLFHNTDNNIYNDNVFIGYDKENSLVKYMVTDYSKAENDFYTMSPTGWYYYDESIADEVEEHYTPKLYVVSSVKYPEDHWYSVAFDENHLIKCFKKEMREEDLTDEEFQNKYSYEQLKNVDGFDIVLK